MGRLPKKKKTKKTLRVDEKKVKKLRGEVKGLSEETGMREYKPPRTWCGGMDPGMKSQEKRKNRKKKKKKGGKKRGGAFFRVLRRNRKQSKKH